jgi:hypothetical protein
MTRGEAVDAALEDLFGAAGDEQHSQAWDRFLAQRRGERDERGDGAQVVVGAGHDRTAGDVDRERAREQRQRGANSGDATVAARGSEGDQRRAARDGPPQRERSVHPLGEAREAFDEPALERLIEDLPATSYFFASIDELVLEALRHFSAEFIGRLEDVTAEIAQTQLAPEQAVDALLAVLLAAPEQRVVAQFEAYLEVTRRPELGAEVRQLVAALERLAQAMLVATGARAGEPDARAFVALLDGFALQRLAWPRGAEDHAALRAALLALHAGCANASEKTLEG